MPSVFRWSVSGWTPRCSSSRPRRRRRTATTTPPRRPSPPCRTACPPRIWRWWRRCRRAQTLRRARTASTRRGRRPSRARARPRHPRTACHPPRATRASTLRRRNACRSPRDMTTRAATTFATPPPGASPHLSAHARSPPKQHPGFVACTLDVVHVHVLTASPRVHAGMRSTRSAWTRRARTTHVMGAMRPRWCEAGWAAAPRSTEAAAPPSSMRRPHPTRHLTHRCRT
jgi:hypothetical protein